MNMTTIAFARRALAAAGCAFFVGGACAAGDAAEGAKAFAACRSCHNPACNGTPAAECTIPKLGGQHADYILAAFNAYGSGLRKDVGMAHAVKSLSQWDMENLATYVARFEPAANPRAAVSGDAMQGAEKDEKCRSCHGEEGASYVSIYPRLAGQHELYLLKALREYKSGARRHASMNFMVKDLSETDLTGLARYYASRKNGLIDIGP